MFCPFSYKTKSCLTFKNQVALFMLFDGVITNVAKLLPNAAFYLRKSRYLGPFQRFGSHFHSSKPNAFCIIFKRHRPGGCSESLCSSCSTASTASGYHFVIRVITGGWLLWRISLFRGDIILQRTRYSKRQLWQQISFSSVALSD